ncbi:MAG: SH3 domain-containing protein [Parvularculaceae bacterium]
MGERALAGSGGVTALRRKPFLYEFNAALAALALAAAGCASDGPAARASVNYAAGSALGAALGEADSAARTPVFVAAREAGAAGERFEWRGVDGFGWVRPGPLRLGGVAPNPDDRPVLTEGVRLDVALEPASGPHALTRNANVRGGPSTDDRILDTLSSGDGVDVLARVSAAPWRLVAREGVVVGYIHENLMTRAPGTEDEAGLGLAGAPALSPRGCRSFEQRVYLSGRTDRWDGVACKDAAGAWSVAPRPEGAPTRLF